MAIFRQIPNDIKYSVYTHKGFYAGIVPIYLVWEEDVDYEDPEGEEMWMAERNGIPRGSINVARALWNLLTIFHPVLPPVIITDEL